MTPRFMRIRWRRRIESYMDLFDLHAAYARSLVVYLGSLNELRAEKRYAFDGTRSLRNTLIAGVHFLLMQVSRWRQRGCYYVN